VKIDEGSRLLEDLVLSEKQFSAGFLDNLDRISFLFVGRRFERSIFGDVSIRRRKKEFRKNVDRLPTSFPLGGDVLVDVVGPEPTFGLAADVLVLASQQKDVDAVFVQIIGAFRHEF
jgi:hypothetical protein